MTAHDRHENSTSRMKLLLSIVDTLEHLSSSQVLSIRFGFISLGSLTVLGLLCVC